MNAVRELLENLELYCKHQLFIRDKNGKLSPFIFNRAQKYMDEQIEDQKKRTGKVRKLILKGRQQGCSTYVSGRFFHSTVTNHGILTFILAHDSSGSSSLYDMVKVYYHNAYDPAFLPELGKSNANEFLFPALRSGYKVGTAGTKGLGRSKTLQQVHWSEVAYSPNCDEHAAGLLQAVPDADNTEIILESTSNGEGDFFHLACMQAMSGKGDFELIFIPWYWQDEYTRKLPDDFELQSPVEGQDFTSEEEYYDTFREDGLTLEHMYWRRKKIETDFKGDISQFMREYPFTPQEAFESSAVDSYIKPMLIRRARNVKPVQTTAPLIFGVDPARMGSDLFKVTHRKGRNTTKCHSYPKASLVQNANRLAKEIDQYKPAIVNIDAGGLGIGIYDILVDLGYGRIVNKVDFGGVSTYPDRYKNMTAEMFGLAREYLEDTPCSMSMLDEKTAATLQAELSARRHDWYQNSILRIESKAEFKKEYGYSPDTADSFLLTFASNVNRTDHQPVMRETIVVNSDWSPF